MLQITLIFVNYKIIFQMSLFLKNFTENFLYQYLLLGGIGICKYVMGANFSHFNFFLYV